MIHILPTDSTQRTLPEMFTYPFHYTPHPLCVQASQEVQNYLQTREDWHEELQKGKMFGVLIVETSLGEIGYLAAFSGILAGKNVHEFFVPPIYDLLQPDGYFKKEEENISSINRNIQAIEQSEEYIRCKNYLAYLKEISQQNIEDFRKLKSNFKELRSFQRKDEELSEKALDAMKRESQYLNAEEKRREQFWQSLIDEQQARLNEFQQQMEAWKAERKSRSAKLQQWLFQQFHILNARNEEQNLCEIFQQTPQRIPPAGAGECAAPKLLQYAYLHQLKPLAMAEFWWGDSSKNEVRHHGHFYPACKHKCEPILNFMLQGLQVEPNPLLTSKVEDELLEIVYEDDYLLVVNKPSGMLSVPGNTNQASVYSILAKKYPEATGPLIVHRLDMDTSGLLVVAKTKEIHAQLQKQFEKQEVKKRYIALLEGVPQADKSGFIRLPLRPDYENRPRQIVDYEIGKAAVTRYEIIERGTHTRIAFYPQTGRTHQLRVHASHADGLNCPIVGDSLYGQSADRLYLHAEKIEFKHPATGKHIRLFSPCPF